MKTKWKQLIFCIAIPLIVGGVSSFLTRGSMAEFEILEKPPLSPPGWIFPIVWTILFILMGIASYLVYVSGADDAAVRSALTVYGIQLIFNFFWSIVFFNLGAYLFAFVWLIILWALIWVNMKMFFKISKPAGYMLLPYFLWVTFAAYLNLGIYLLN